MGRHRHHYWEFLPDRVAETKELLRAETDDAAIEDADEERWKTRAPSSAHCNTFSPATSRALASMTACSILEVLHQLPTE